VDLEARRDEKIEDFDSCIPPLSTTGGTQQIAVEHYSGCEGRYDLPVQLIKEFEEASLSFVHGNPCGQNRDTDARTDVRWLGQHGAR
jgi:hypothetical protein